MRVKNLIKKKYYLWLKLAGYKLWNVIRKLKMKLNCSLNTGRALS